MHRTFNVTMKFMTKTEIESHWVLQINIEFILSVAVVSCGQFLVFVISVPGIPRYFINYYASFSVCFESQLGTPWWVLFVACPFTGRCFCRLFAWCDRSLHAPQFEGGERGITPSISGFWLITANHYVMRPDEIMQHLMHKRGSHPTTMHCTLCIVLRNHILLGSYLCPSPNLKYHPPCLFCLAILPYLD